MAVNVLTLSTLSLKILPHIIANLLNRKISIITQLYTDRCVDDLNCRNPPLSYKNSGASSSTFKKLTRDLRFSFFTENKTRPLIHTVTTPTGDLDK